MYMRNNRYDRRAKYNIDGFPPNYSGQYTKETMLDDEPKSGGTLNVSENAENFLHNPNDKKEPEESKEKKGGGLFGNLFGGHKDGKKGGLLSGLFGGEKEDEKDGGLFSRIELEDLILIAVIFFLLKDGFEDDLILILAIILFSA